MESVEKAIERLQPSNFKAFWTFKHLNFIVNGCPFFLNSVMSSVWDGREWTVIASTRVGRQFSNCSFSSTRYWTPTHAGTHITAHFHVRSICRKHVGGQSAYVCFNLYFRIDNVCVWVLQVQMYTQLCRGIRLGQERLSLSAPWC